MLVRIGVAAALVGACTATLRRWEAAGVLVPACRTPGGHRRYDARRGFTGTPAASD